MSQSQSIATNNKIMKKKAFEWIQPELMVVNHNNDLKFNWGNISIASMCKRTREVWWAFQDNDFICYWLLYSYFVQKQRKKKLQ